MRTHTSIGVLVCVGLTFIARDARALWITFDQSPQAVSIADLTDLPLNIAVSPDLHEVVTDMLHESETFRRQIRIIAGRPELRVRIMLGDQADGPRAARAKCDLARYEFGAVTALVHVFVRDDVIELIAHELEHVIEFVEGANYRAQTVVRRGSVWGADGVFETTRAIEAGLQVKGEVALASAYRRR